MKIESMSGDGCYEPLSRENGHKIARWFTPKSKYLICYKVGGLDD